MIMPTEDSNSVSPSSEGDTANKNKYEYTVFKSGYWFGNYQCQMFLNYGYGEHPDSFSILLKKGKYSQIHNLTKDEKLSFAKAIISKLTQEELKSIL